MESFHQGQRETLGIRQHRKDVMGEDYGARILRILNSRGGKRVEITAAKALDHNLRSAFPGVVIRTHLQPMKK